MNPMLGSGNQETTRSKRMNHRLFLRNDNKVSFIYLYIGK